MVPGTTVTLLNPHEAYTSYGADNPVQFPRDRMTPYHNQYHEHFVYRLDFEGGGQDAFVWGLAGLVHGRCTLIGGAYWAMYPTQVRLHCEPLLIVSPAQHFAQHVTPPPPTTTTTTIITQTHTATTNLLASHHPLPPT
jgi:hypothetical protein